MSDSLRGQRETFFKMVFGQNEGFVCIATIPAATKNFTEVFFMWPEQIPDMLTYIEERGATHNIYFCPQLLHSAKRNKDTVEDCPVAWADLDTCSPDKLRVAPSLVVESSPGRYQAYWVFEHVMDPSTAEDISKRIAYAHKGDGADKSGWDLSQLLRVPFTLNFKYGILPTEAPPVKTIRATRAKYRPDDFDIYPPVAIGSSVTPLPGPENLPEGDANDIVQKYRMRINGNAFGLISQEPPAGTSWSEPLYKLLMFCFEAGMSKEEAFKVAQGAACNKFKRDGRPDSHLWNDVNRAYATHLKHVDDIREATASEPDMMTDEERELALSQESFIDRYINWASGLGDAAPQYHQAGGFVLLSSMLCGTVLLPTSFGPIYPNLWFMILADTTLTRKSTSMDFATGILEEVQEQVILAHDGSVEGLITGLSTRPQQPSVFVRDEFTGLLEQMTKRDYMAGMPELLTKLYDGKTQKRLLRREVVEVKNPRLIIYAGGIKSKTQEILSYEQIASGFLPRFIFISAESDLTKVKPLGPPTERNWGRRNEIIEELQDIAHHYNQPDQVVVNGRQVTVPTPRLWEARMVEDAWVRYNILEAMLNKVGVESAFPDLYTPLYDRLGKSILKTAVLIAASRQRGDEVVVEEIDMLCAIRYGEMWRAYLKDLVINIGKSKTEKKMAQVMKFIQDRNGCSRAAVMRHFSLDNREAQQILDTLEQRGYINTAGIGKNLMLSPND